MSKKGNKKVTMVRTFWSVEKSQKKEIEMMAKKMQISESEVVRNIIKGTL